MLKEKQLEEIKSFVSSTEEGTLEIGHAKLSVMSDDYPPENYHGYAMVVSEDSLFIDVRVSGVDKSKWEEIAIALVDAINSDAPLCDESELKDFFEDSMIWWGSESSSEHHLKVKNKNLNITITDVVNDSGTGEWKDLNFSHLGLDFQITFDVAESLSPILVANVIYNLYNI